MNTSKHEAIERLLGAGKIEQAHAAAVQLAARSPRDPIAAVLASMVALRAGELVQAEYYARRAAGLVPGDAAVLLHASHVLAVRGRNDESLRLLRESLRLAPARDCLLAAQILLRIGRPCEALEHCDAGIAASPTDRALRVLRAGAQLECGSIEVCVDALRCLMLEVGDDVRVCSSLCNALDYDHRADPASVRAMHQTFGRIVARHRPDRLIQVRPPDCTFGRRLRIGVLSPDLRDHSCAFFIDPLFEHHDRAKLELFAYHTSLVCDDTTNRLKGHAAKFRHEWRISDQKLAELIRSDRIDVLLDLSGHTRGDSLVAVHLKPALLQVGYLGYPNITGLDAVDVHLVDSITDPPEPLVTGEREQPVRLDPCFLCLRPPEGLPACVPPGAAAGWTPCGQRGGVTFGSCNALQKINAEVVALWSRLVNQVPGSRLVVKAANLREEALRERVKARFVAAGIAGDRIEILAPHATRAEHLAFYRTVDVALDTFPYNGTTTTCDALLMGVPVVTLSGRVHASRVGASLLGAVGCGEWVADNQESYIARAAGLAGDVPLRAALRTGLREQVLSSVLCDGVAFARRFEKAIDLVWRTIVCGESQDPLRSSHA